MTATVSAAYAAPQTGTARPKLSVLASMGLIAGVSTGLWIVIGHLVSLLAGLF